MMLDPKVAEALNVHVNAEMYSAYLYYSMADWCENANLGGYAHWMRIQAVEEMAHAHRMVKYIHDRGASVRFSQIDAPPQQWEDVAAIMLNTYQHEQSVTQRINGLLKLSMDAADFATSSMLQWYVAEQVEEEANAETLLQRTRMISDNNGALFMLDRELAARPMPAADLFNPQA